MSGTAIDFADHINKSTTGFTGRDWVFKAINNWLTDANESRYFLLTGMPGSGKTAIAARLVQFSQGVPPPTGCDRLAGALSAWHFCSARDTEWFDPRTFASTLASQLATRYPPFRQALWQKQHEDRNITITNIQHIGQVAGSVTGMNLTVHVGNIPPLDAFSRVVREPLLALFAAEPDTRLVILVDALDEALLYGATESIVWLLSKIDNLPKGVRFILTSRKVVHIEHSFRTATNLFLSAKSSTKHNLKDTRRYIEERLLHDDVLKAAVGAMSAVQVQRAMVEMTRKAAGNFLYIRFFLDSVAQGTRSLDQLDGLPRGLDALYFDSLQHVLEQEKGDWYKDYAPLMGVLAVAQESLTQVQLEALTGQRASIIRQHMRALQPFFEHVDVKKQEKKYRLYHQSMIDFFDCPEIVGEKKKAVVKEEEDSYELEWENIEDAYEDELEWEEIEDDEEEQNEESLDNIFYLSLKEWHSHMARRCEQGDMADIWVDKPNDAVEQSRREYARKYYVNHLYHGDGDKEQEHLFAVLDEGEYGRAKIKHDFNALAYARDLELGQQAAMRNTLSHEEKINLLPFLWRYSLLRCSLSTQADNYPDQAIRVMVLLKHHQKAIATVELISDRHRKTRLLIYMGVALTKLGIEDLARQVMMRARDVLATSVQSDPRIIQTALQEIAELRPFTLEVPFLNEIAAVGQFIEDAGQCASILVAIAVALSQAEACEQADALACTIPYAALDGKTREEIVQTLVKAELWESATLIAQSIFDDPQMRGSAQGWVIAGLSRAQKWEKARALALTTDPSHRFLALVEIALNRVLVEPKIAEDLVKELYTVPLASDQDRVKWHARRVIAQIWARAHQWDRAIDIVMSYRDYYGIIALEVLEQMLHYYDLIASEVLEQMLKDQQWDKAIKLVSSLERSNQQLELLNHLVKALIEAKQVEHVFVAILDLIQEIGQREQSRKEPDNDVLLKIVTLLVKLQLWDDVQQTINQMKNSWQQCQALAVIADALSQEQPARARQLIFRAESIVFSLKKFEEDDVVRSVHANAFGQHIGGRIMRTIVDVLAQMQLWDRAMALAHMISIRWSTNDRDEAFSSIVEALGHTQAWKQAVETAQNIESDTVQSRAFSSIVEALGRTQAWKQAIEVAQNIECHTEQSNALKAVVEDMLYSQEWQPILAVIQVIKQPKQRFEALMALIESRTHVQWMSQGERTETLDSEDGLLSITAEEQFWDAIITTAQQLFEEDCRSAEMVVELLQTLAQAEQWERALKIADTPSLKEYRADILFVIALFMMHAGLDEKALALARSIDAPMRKAEAFALLAVECIHQSQLAEALLNEALAAIQIIADDEHEAFASLALQLNKAGRWQKALQIACSIRQPSERIKVLVDLARARKDTDLEQTITLLRETIAVIRDFIRTVDREDEMEVLFLIYKVNDVIAPFSALCDNIDIITHDEYKNKIQVYIKEFENMLNEEGISGILASITKKYVNTTEDEDSKNENESVLQRDEVESLAEKQQWEKMLARVWSTDASWQKTQALVYIATTLVRTGQREKGLLLLLEAEAVAHSIKEDRDRDNALVDVVDALTTIWDLDNAKVVVEFIEDVELQDGPRLLITRTLAQAQRWDEAKEEARHIGGSLKVSAMNSITDTMLLCGEYEQALQYIQTNWAQAGMRDELIKLLPLVEEFIPLYPELGEACYDAFTWVDHFLQF